MAGLYAGVATSALVILRVLALLAGNRTGRRRRNLPRGWKAIPAQTEEEAEESGRLQVHIPADERSKTLLGNTSVIARCVLVAVLALVAPVADSGGASFAAPPQCPPPVEETALIEFGPPVSRGRRPLASAGPTPSESTDPTPGDV